jgi:hypothetical protein
LNREGHAMLEWPVAVRQYSACDLDARGASNPSRSGHV